MKYLIFGSNSDIATAFLKHLHSSEPHPEVITFSRSPSSDFQIDWSSSYSPLDPSKCHLLQDWDCLISFIGSQAPIGAIHLCDPLDIIHGVNINFTYQYALLSECLRFRNLNSPTKVLFFAGGGTNSAPVLYSTYISSKIALIKLTELIYAEYPDVHSTIIGPGWVKSKIHETTLSDLGQQHTPHSYLETKRRFEQNDFVPLDMVIDCLATIISEPSSKYAGRNISVQHDPWKSTNFLSSSTSSDSLFKLRRLS